MSRLLDYLKAAAGEVSFASRLGAWRQAISISVDNLTSLVALISGGGLLPATGTTTGARPLSGYNTALLETGDEVFVQGINEPYYFDATSELVADQLDVVSAVGPGRFIRASTVIVQANWYVDSVNGDDENPGTVALPLQTLAELGRRLNYRSISALTTLTINLSGAFSEQLSLDLTSTGQTLVVVTASVTVNYSGVIGTYTAFNAAGGVRATLQDAGLVAATHLRRRVRLTNGASSGAITWICSAAAADTANIGQFYLNTGVSANPANGTGYDVETLSTSIRGYDVRITGGGNTLARTFRLENVEILPTTAESRATCYMNVNGATNLLAMAYGCKFNATTKNVFLSGYQSVYACANIGTSALSLQFSEFWGFVYGACGFGTWQLNNSTAVTGSNSIHDGNGADRVGMFITSNSYLRDVGHRGFFNSTAGSAPTQVVEVSWGGRWVMSAAASVFWGSGNTHQVALRVYSGSYVVYVTKPTCTASAPGSDVILANEVALAWAAIPAQAAVPPNQAYVVVYQ